MSKMVDIINSGIQNQFNRYFRENQEKDGLSVDQINSLYDFIHKKTTYNTLDEIAQFFSLLPLANNDQLKQFLTEIKKRKEPLFDKKVFNSFIKNNQQNLTNYIESRANDNAQAIYDTFSQINLPIIPVDNSSDKEQEIKETPTRAGNTPFGGADHNNNESIENKPIKSERIKSLTVKSFDNSLPELSKKTMQDHEETNHQGLKNDESTWPNLKESSNAVLDNLEVQSIPFLPSAPQYIVVDSISLWGKEPTKLFSLNHHNIINTDIYFCFKDQRIAQQYQERINNYQAKLRELKAKTENFKKKQNMTKEEEQQLKTAVKEIENLNKEIQKVYAEAETAAYSGYRIVRKNSLKNLTNQSSEAKYIEITTKCLNEKDALRIRLRSGAYLEIHLDENGNFNPNNPPVPLTLDGSKQRRLFNNTDTDPNLVYNNYKRVLEDLDFMEEFKINGDDVLSIIKESIQEKNDEREGLKNQNNQEEEQNEQDDFVNNKNNHLRINIANNNEEQDKHQKQVLYNRKINIGRSHN